MIPRRQLIVGEMANQRLFMIDADRLAHIGQQQGTVDFAVERVDAHAVRSADDASRDLAAVGNQDLADVRHGGRTLQATSLHRPPIDRGGSFDRPRHPRS